MNIHKNARLTPRGRERMVKMMLNGQTPARKWFARYQAEGLAGLQDRSSRPKKLRQPTAAKTVERIIALRRQRLTGKHIAHLKAAVAYYRHLGVTVKRVMTDNGPCYKSHAFAATCKKLGIKHIRTKPYTPRTNGKAERFIQTALREWAYAGAYQTSQQRAQDLPKWTHMYNWHRPHGEIKDQTPIRSAQSKPGQPIEALQLERCLKEIYRGRRRLH